jgi:hypothetical protein
MPRGSRPGERRGGRKPGTPNKKTLLKNAVFLAAAGGGTSAEPNRSPLDFMLALMRDPQVPLKDRVLMAEAAAAFVHARPRRPSRDRPHPMELRARAAKAAARTGGANGATPGREESLSLQSAVSGSDENPTLQRAPSEGAEQAELVGGGEAVVVRLAGVGPHATERFEIRPPSPLDFLLAVMTDPDADPKERMRAAQVAARYTHRPPAEKPQLVEDEFGFRIDPVVAKAVRAIKGQSVDSDTKNKAGRAIKSQSVESDTKQQDQLAERLREQVGTIECPECYGERDLEKDTARLDELRARRGTKAKLTAEEDAEEAYLTTRAEVYRATPQHHAWHRILAFQRYLTLGYTLTADELGELDQLRARFPKIARQLAGIDGLTEQDPHWLDLCRAIQEAERRGIELDHEQIRKKVIEEVRQENLARKRQISDDNTEGTKNWLDGYREEKARFPQQKPST